MTSELSSFLSSGPGRAAFCCAADQKRSTQLLPLVTESLSLSNASALALGLSLTHSQCEPVKNAAKDFVQVKLPLVLEEVCQSPLKVMHSISYIKSNISFRTLPQSFTSSWFTSGPIQTVYPSN